MTGPLLVETADSPRRLQDGPACVAAMDKPVLSGRRTVGDELDMALILFEF
jgi:hypothetical protein